MKKHVFNMAVAALSVVAFGGCFKDNEGGASGGTPVVRYVRPCDAAVSDSLLTGAYLGERIAIIGEHLAGVSAVYFNDQKAKLNPNFVTDNAIILNVPSGIPGVKQDMIKLYTSADSCHYEFEILVPAPTVSSMTCEYVEDGAVAYIQGLYFVSEPDNPLKVTFKGNVQGEIVTSDVNNIAVKVPAGAQAGPIKVASVYGVTESGFHFRDNRNIILDFDHTYPDGGYNHGWHKGKGYGTENGINGQYLIFQGTMNDDTWDDSNFGYERWTYRSTDPDFFDAGKPESYALKFEVNIPDAWSSSALQIIFTGAEEVWMNWQEADNGGNANNSYVSDNAYPRALWNPWVANGSFKTDGWITVTIPMTDFKYNKDGGAAAAKGAGHYSGITLFVNGGGVAGTECTPTFHIDNVRIVPIK
jgi:hypothetical protein